MLPLLLLFFLSSFYPFISHSIKTSVFTIPYSLLFILHTSLFIISSFTPYSISHPLQKYNYYFISSSYFYPNKYHNKKCDKEELVREILLVATLTSVFEVAKWLRSQTANPMCSAGVGLNPILVGMFYLFDCGLIRRYQPECRYCQVFDFVACCPSISLKTFPLLGIDPRPPG